MTGAQPDPSGGRSSVCRTVAVIPAYNEAPAIASVVGDALALRKDRQPLFDEVIVVDNLSTDQTAELAYAAGATLVGESRRGYGSACLAGIAAAGRADVIVFIDGDASVDLRDAARLLAPLSEGADLVIGARRNPAAAAMSLPQRFGNWLAAALIRGLWGAAVTDLGPFRAVRRAALERLAMQDLTYGWTVEMQIKAIQRGLRMIEVPVNVKPRIGESKISGTLHGVVGAGIGILSMIGRLWLLQRRQRSSPLDADTLADPAASLEPASLPHHNRRNS